MPIGLLRAYAAAMPALEADAALTHVAVTAIATGSMQKEHRVAQLREWQDAVRGPRESRPADGPKRPTADTLKRTGLAFRRVVVAPAGA